MQIQLGSTAKLIQGSVLDTNKRALELTLRRYDPLLYIVWNPSKRKGLGVWEIRRRPEKKTAVHQGVYNGTELYTLEYKENSFINHILDAPVLHYGLLEKLRSMDSWLNGYSYSEMEYKHAKFTEEKKEKERKETMYRFMQNRKAIREWRELIASGDNPARIAQFWGRNIKP